MSPYIVLATVHDGHVFMVIGRPPLKPALEILAKWRREFDIPLDLLLPMIADIATLDLGA